MSNRQFVRGSKIFGSHNRILAQELWRFFTWTSLGFILLFLGVLFHKARYAMLVVCLWGYASLLNTLNLSFIKVWNGAHHSIPAKYLVHNGSWKVAYFSSKKMLLHYSLFALKVSGGFYILSLILIAKFLTKKGEKYTQNKHISGTRLTKNPKELTRSISKGDRGVSDIKLLGTIPMPKRSEFQGIFLHGSTGSGKTQAIMRLLDEIRRLGEPAIIYDKECTIKPYFFNKDIDIELNPISALCANWDAWLECSNPMEWGSIAAYQIPKSIQGGDPFWVDSGRTIFTSMAWKLKDREDRSHILLLQMLLTSTLEEMRNLLKGTESENLVSREIEKTAISIKSVLATYIKSWRFLEGLDKSGKPKFSIKEWVKDAIESESPQKGWLFITSRSNYHKEIKPLISLWLGLAMQGIQSLKPNTNKRIWLIMDELASLHRLEMLSDTLSDIRKFGGCVAVGIQSISQLEFLYGNHEAHAITDLLNTSLYFRSPKSKVAKWVSEDLGEHILDEVRESQSYGPGSVRDGNTITTQRVTRKTVDAGEIMTMEDLHCYVRVIGNHPIAKIKTEYVEREVLIEPLVERAIDFDALEKINQQALTAQHNPDVDGSVRKIQALAELSHEIVENEELLEKPVADELLKIERVEMAHRYESSII